jgi:hypothetical protein
MKVRGFTACSVLCLKRPVGATGQNNDFARGAVCTGYLSRSLRLTRHRVRDGVRCCRLGSIWERSIIELDL